MHNSQSIMHNHEVLATEWEPIAATPKGSGR